jgi:hypothetical protein
MRRQDREPGSCGRPRLGSRAILSALGIALAMVAFAVNRPASAEASQSRYVFEICDSSLPGGGIDGARDSLSPGEPWTPAQNCSEPGGSFALHLSGGLGVGGWSGWGLPIEPPPGGRMESTTVSAAFCPSSGVSGYVIQEGWPAPICREETRTFYLPEKTRGLEIDLSCPENCAQGAVVYAHYIATVMVDPVAPSVSEVGGSLLAGGAQRGRRSVSAKAGDVGGGLSALSVLVNGTQVASNPQPCAIATTDRTSVVGVVATQVTPCPTSASAEWELQTALPPFREGDNTVQVCASDFATLGDPDTTCSPPQNVDVDDSCAESPVGGATSITAGFEGGGQESVTVGYGKEAELAGTLTDGAGEPISGATVCVQTQTEGGNVGPLSTGTTTTDGQGHFDYAIRPGPDRRVLVGYRHDSFELDRTLSARTHARPGLKLSHGRLPAGSRVAIQGTLPGPRATGRVVVLQASSLHGRRWLTFRRATTTRGGDFTASYRFGATSQTITYRLRAFVPRQRGYPYRPGASRPARVKVFGKAPARRR